MPAARESRAARIRLAAANLVVLALVLIVTLGAAAFSAYRSSHALVDQELHEVGARVVAHLEHDRSGRAHEGEEHEEKEEDDDDDHPRRAEPRSGDDAFASAEVGDEPGVIVILAPASAPPRRADGRALPAGLPHAGAVDAALAGTETMTDVSVGATPMRLLTTPIRRGTAVVGAVQLAKPTAEARASLARTLAILGLTGLAGLVLSAFGSLFLAARALRPIELALERQRRFIADASHELRTPVAVLRARAELLAQEGSPLPPLVRGELAQLHRDADELSELLGELLDLARLEADPALLAVGPVPIGDVAEEIATQLAPLAREREITLTARTGPVFAVASSARVRQVLRALVDNALAHTPPGGHVTIEAGISEGRAQLSVTDDGAGIAPEDLPNVKERFYRADPSRTRGASGRRGGAGLGLSIAYELVLKMRGELRIESALGRGTTMTVVLPLAEGAPPA